MRLLNSSLSLVKSYRYDEFGIDMWTGSYDNPFKFTGEFYDTYSDNYYLRARNYDQKLGRFLERDTYEGEQGDTSSRNLFTYCGNEPIMRLDHSGNCWKFGWRYLNSTISV